MIAQLNFLFTSYPHGYPEPKSTLLNTRLWMDSYHTTFYNMSVRQE